jgi:hypothetical protein
MYDASTTLLWTLSENPRGAATAAPEEMASANKLPTRSDLKVEVRDMMISCAWFEVVEHPGLAARLDRM